MHQKIRDLFSRSVGLQKSALLPPLLRPKFRYVMKKNQNDYDADENTNVNDRPNLRTFALVR